MKLYKEHTKEPYSFFVNDITLSLDNLDLGRTYNKMSICEKIKAIDSKIKQNKAQYN